MQRNQVGRGLPWWLSSQESACPLSQRVRHDWVTKRARGRQDETGKQKGGEIQLTGSQRASVYQQSLFWPLSVHCKFNWKTIKWETWRGETQKLADIRDYAIQSWHHPKLGDQRKNVCAKISTLNLGITSAVSSEVWIKVTIFCISILELLFSPVFCVFQINLLTMVGCCLATKYYK